MSTIQIYWLVLFDNGGQLTVVADSLSEAYKIAEEKAQSHGWNLRAVNATRIR